MIIYNGFKPGEVRERKLRPRKKDQGHSIVLTSTRRAGDDFRFHYRMECECGKVFKSSQVQDRCFRSHTAHLRKEGVL